MADYNLNDIFTTMVRDAIEKQGLVEKTVKATVDESTRSYFEQIITDILKQNDTVVEAVRDAVADETRGYEDQFNDLEQRLDDVEDTGQFDDLSEEVYLLQKEVKRVAEKADGFITDTTTTLGERLEQQNRELQLRIARLEQLLRTLSRAVLTEYATDTLP